MWFSPSSSFSSVAKWLRPDWWNDEWSFRKKITLDTTATGAAIADPIGTTPVLIRLHAGNFQFDGAKENGSDIRFVAEDNKTLLPYHIEKYDRAHGGGICLGQSSRRKARGQDEFLALLREREPQAG